jgi:hypothetical protein
VHAQVVRRRTAATSRPQGYGAARPPREEEPDEDQHDEDVPAVRPDHPQPAVLDATPFQAAVNSIRLYPFVAIVEKNERPFVEMIAPKRGTEWLK